jgi:hypothetical protein
MTTVHLAPDGPRRDCLSRPGCRGWSSPNTCPWAARVCTCRSSAPWRSPRACGSPPRLFIDHKVCRLSSRAGAARSYRDSLPADGSLTADATAPAKLGGGRIDAAKLLGELEGAFGLGAVGEVPAGLLAQHRWPANARITVEPGSAAVRRCLRRTRREKRARRVFPGWRYCFSVRHNSD